MNPSRFWLYAVESVLLLAALAAFTITEQYKPQVTAGLILLAVSFLLRVLRTGRIVPRTGLEAPALMFVLSAGAAAWIAYDPNPAYLQFARVLAMAALYYAVIDAPRIGRNLLVAGLLAGAAALAVYFPLQHDFISQPAKFAPLTTIGVWINQRVPPAETVGLTHLKIHSNVAAGTLAVSLPVALLVTWRAWHRRRFLAATDFSLVALLILGSLLLTSSRGAWVGCLAAFFLAVLAWIQQRWFTGLWLKRSFWMGVIVLVLVIITLLITTGRLATLLGTLPDPNGSLQSRLEIWGQSLPLLRDYIFTGAGLMSFRLVYSIYGILIHTPYLDHLHNMYLEVIIEQGIFGAIALVWAILVVAGWAWKAASPRQQPLQASALRGLGWAGLFALSIAAVHGIFDVVFYVERTLPVVGLLLGMAYFSQVEEGEENLEEPVQSGQFSLGQKAVGLAVFGLAVFLAVTFFRAPMLSAWYANLGAVEQTRRELPNYDPVHFDNPTLDEIRRTVNLDRAESYFLQSLVWQPGNPTARQRLASLALARSQYDQALIEMKAAWDAGHSDSSTRLLLGDTLVASGYPKEAAELVSDIRWAETRLTGQAFYRYWLGVPPDPPDYQRAIWASEAVLAINPANGNALWVKSQAERMLNRLK